MKNDPLSSVGIIDIIIFPYVHALVNTKTEHGDLKVVVRNEDLYLQHSLPPPPPPPPQKKKKGRKMLTISHSLETVDYLMSSMQKVSHTVENGQ